MIPEGWKLTKLAEGIELVSGQHVEAQYVNEEGAGEPYLTGPADFDGGKIISSKFTDFANKFCEEGDVLVTVKGSGTGRIVRADRRYAISRQLMSIKARGFDSNFLYFLVSSKVGSYEGAAAGLIPGISRVDILNADVLAPPVSEQIRIAKIISSWDEVIGVSERMLESSRKQKRALMQQLLAGKRRLPGFEGEWGKVELKEALDYQQPGQFIVKSTEYSNNYKTPVLTAGKSFVLGYSNEEDGVYDQGLPVIIFDDFTTASRLVGFPFKVKSSAIKILTSRPGFSVKYVFEAMQMIPFVVGGHQRHWISIFSNLVIPCPSFEEQKAIAEVLSQADAEIEALQRRLDCLRQEKKALMQQLLTGKRRVKVEATAPTEEAAC